jgi:hypothetical protein
MKSKFKKLSLMLVLASLTAFIMMFGLSTGNVWAHEADPHPHAEDSKAPGEPESPSFDHKEHGSLGAVGAKLANPLSSLWSLSMNFETPKYYDGDINTGDPRMGADMIFQPVMPIPLCGKGDAQWRVITRPVIPIVFAQPIPEGFNKFDRKNGIGDIQLPLLLSVPGKYAGNWILGGGPIGLFPSATNNDLGSNQWAFGPAVVLGYKTKDYTAILFPNYFWKTGSSGQDDNTPDICQGTLLYSLTFNLPNAMQVGMHPTISYNHKAGSGDKWNVPVGLFFGKTIKLGKLPVNIKLGVEYSVVSPDTFGKRTNFRIEITPVVPSLIDNPIFGN